MRKTITIQVDGPLTPYQRVRLFDLQFSNTISKKEGSSTMYVHNGRICGLWSIGALYKRNFYKNPGGYYGGYPHKFKERAFALFPDCERILHLFSGTIRPKKSKLRTELTFDIKPELHPSICDDVRHISRYAPTIRRQDLILSDPMYERSDFEKNGTIPFDKWGVIRQLGEIMRPGAFLAWLDTRVPMFSNKTWHRVVSIGVEVSTNTRIRSFTVLQRRRGSR